MVNQSSQQEPILNIVGDKVALGPHRRDLLPLYQKWLNDFEVIVYLGNTMQPMTLEAEEAWYNRATQEDDQRRIGFTIYERATLRPIGTTGLGEIDHRQRTAEFGIVIGEKDCWNKGYGTEATSLMLDYGFTALGLHNIMLRVFSYNERAYRAYKRAGFHEMGRRRQARRFGDKAYDVIWMDCLATEFEGAALRRVLPDG